MVGILAAEWRSPQPPVHAAANVTCKFAWQEIPGASLGTSQNWFSSVVALAPDNVWAVGEQGDTYFGGQTLIEHWNGMQWDAVASPNIANASQTLNAVAGASANDLWAVGTYSQNHSVQPLVLRGDGSAWNIAPAPDLAGDNAELNDVVAIAANDVWTAGTRWVNSKRTMLLAHWDGAQWAVMNTPFFAKDASLQTIFVRGANDIWAGGSNLMHWDGVTWQIIPGIRNVTDVLALAADNVWVATTRKTMHWNGNAWRDVPVAQYTWGFNSLGHFAALAPDDIYATGTYQLNQHRYAIIQHWDGKAWSLAPLNWYYAESFLQDISAASANELWAVGHWQTSYINGDFATLSTHAGPICAPPTGVPPTGSHRPPNVPAAPQLVAPENGATLHTQSPILRWKTVPNARTYRVELRQAKRDGERVEISSIVNSTITPTLIANTAYLWRVRACNAVGCGPWSETRKFTITIP